MEPISCFVILLWTFKVCKLLLLSELRSDGVLCVKSCIKVVQSVYLVFTTLLIATVYKYIQNALHKQDNYSSWFILVHMNMDMNMHVSVEQLPRCPPSQRRRSTSYDVGPTAEPTLSVSAEDSGIMSILLFALSSMWDKASELLLNENGITAAPGSDPKARMVISYSQDAPHHIRSCSDGQYLCDSQCPLWISSQICSHTIADMVI